MITSYAYSTRTAHVHVRTTSSVNSMPEYMTCMCNLAFARCVFLYTFDILQANWPRSEGGKRGLERVTHRRVYLGLCKSDLFRSLARYARNCKIYCELC